MSFVRKEIFIVMLKLMTQTCTLTATCSEEGKKELKGMLATADFIKDKSPYGLITAPF